MFAAIFGREWVQIQRKGKLEAMSCNFNCDFYTGEFLRKSYYIYTYVYI